MPAERERSPRGKAGGGAEPRGGECSARRARRGMQRCRARCGQAGAGARRGEGRGHGGHGAERCREAACPVRPPRQDRCRDAQRRSGQVPQGERRARQRPQAGKDRRAGGAQRGVAPARAGKEDRRQAPHVRVLRVRQAPGAGAAGQQDRPDAGKRRQHRARRHPGRAGKVHEMPQDLRGKVGGDSGHAAGAGPARDRGRVYRECPGGRGHRRPRGAAARPEDLAVSGTEGPQGHRPRPGGGVRAHLGIRRGPRHVSAVRRDPRQDRRGPGVRLAGLPGGCGVHGMRYQQERGRAGRPFPSNRDPTPRKKG